MKINQSTRIDNKKGDWVVLNDFGSEGFTVHDQYKTPEEAIKGMSSSTGCPQTIVKLIEFTFTVEE